MKILHIQNTDKFILPFNTFINKNFDVQDHKFCVYTHEKNFEFKVNLKNLLYINSIYRYLMLICEMYKSQKIIIHGLYSTKILLIFFLQPWLLKKTSWVIWGADLYEFRKQNRTWKKELKELVKSLVVKKFGSIITLVEGDYALAKEWYNVSGVYQHGAYINPITKDYLDSLEPLNGKNANTVCIQIGNSADPSNKHIEILQKLEKYKNENIMIYAPLSYGDMDYAKNVIKEGEKIFKKKFIPMTKFLSPEEYSAYLNNIDIAIFNNDRQQALGNIYALLYLGKKVFIRSDTAMSNHFKGKFNINLEDSLNIGNINFDEFIYNPPTDNQSKISCVFDESYLQDIWRRIFNAEVR